MSPIVSTAVIVFTVLSIAGCVWLLVLTARKRPEDLTQDPTTGHVWDGDLTEYNNPLPRWWLNMFYLTIVFGVGYLIFYPGLGNLTGRLGWTSQQQHDLDTQKTRASFAAAYAPYQNMQFEQLVQEPGAMALGQSIFMNTCAGCHGSDARGAKGFPNLTDSDWLYGGEPEVILTTLRMGRQGVMPGWKTVVGDEGVAELVAYVQKLSGTPAGDTLASRGKQRYDMLCIGCHGPEGKGDRAIGSPNLTDQTWLYGDDPDSLTVSIAVGRSGVMPTQAQILSEEQIRLVGAWVYSHGKAAPSATEGVSTQTEGSTP